MTSDDPSLADRLPPDKSCQLLGPTALVVQAVLGVFVIISLLYKRHREPRKRPWAIWIFDVSKQVVGQMFIHGVNVLVSDIISEYTDGNACVFYFLHILIDTTIGIGLLYLILYALSHLIVEKLQWKGFESGVYGSPPSINFWARQAAVYVLALTTMKIIVIAVIIFFPGTFKFGEWLLSWTRVGKDDSVQVIFTMGIFPIIMNVLQFWLIDSIVKASTKSVALDEDPTDNSPDAREPLFRAPSEEDGDDAYRHDDIEHAREPRHPVPVSKSTETEPPEYKSGTTSPDDDPADHSYPPSLSSSFSSGSSAPRPAKNLLKNAKRRGAPAPLSVQNNYPPAVNSPSALLSSTQPIIPMPIAPARIEAAPKESNANAWAETWDEDDDWAHRAEEEDRKERNIEVPVVINDWDTNPGIRVGS